MSQREIAIQLILDEVGKGHTIDEAVQRIINRPKEQPMSDTLQEREDQKGWLSCCQGYTHAPWCSLYEKANERRPGDFMNHATYREQLASEHEPAARGGGEWQASKPLTNQILRNDIGGSYLIAGIDVLTSDHDHFGKIAVFGDDCNEVVVQIITEHNQHQSLVAERERLRDALGEMLNRFYPHTCDRGPLCAKCGALRAAQSVFNETDNEQRSTSE